MSIGGATYDLFVQVPHEVIRRKDGEAVFALPLGQKVRVENLQESCGGGASNTAVGLQLLGCAARFEGVIGSDQWGEKLLENFTNEGVDARCATVVEGEVTSFSIVLTGTGGERIILYEPGTNAHLHKANFDIDEVAKMDWVYLNHIQEGACVLQDDIVDVLAHEHPRLTWNPGGCQIDSGIRKKANLRLLKYTDLLLLNKEESLAFTESKTTEEAMRKLLACGVHSLCITDGGRGVLGTDGKTLYHCPCLPVPVVEVTGAGDAFGTGITWALLTGKDFPTALKAGTINAASVVSSVGAEHGLLTEKEMLARLASENLEVQMVGQV